jgi:hypothetical protein
VERYRVQLAQLVHPPPVLFFDPLQLSCREFAGSRQWYTLMRRDAGDAVSGRLQLGFAWDVTARSLLSLKLQALENVLSQRQEILCALNPVPPYTTLKWMKALAASKDKESGKVIIDLPADLADSVNLFDESCSPVKLLDLLRGM